MATARGTSAGILCGVLGLLTAACIVPVSMPSRAESPPGDNDHPEIDWVRLNRQKCVGGFGSPGCDSYQVTVFADGRVLWEGDAFVDEIGERTRTISAKKATQLIERTEQRIEPLRRRQCGIDHTHYVFMDVGRAGKSSTRRVRGCGERFYRVARPIDRIAQTRRWR